MDTKTARIRALNDELRQNFAQGIAVMTPGIAGLGAEAVARIVKTIAVFDDFCHANDPHQEHDFGAFDADGYLRILDRKKDMVNVSGFKVFPNEVEDVMAQHPGVLESAVIGVADPHTGQGVKLFVVKRDPALMEEDLTKFARERLAAYKVPRVIVFVDSLPKSNVGKIVRKDLR